MSQAQKILNILSRATRALIFWVISLGIALLAALLFFMGAIDAIGNLFESGRPSPLPPGEDDLGMGLMMVGLAMLLFILEIPLVLLLTVYIKKKLSRHIN